MRHRLARCGGVLAIFLLFGGLQACSGQQQEEGDLEATEESEQGYDQQSEDTEQGYDEESAQESGQQGSNYDYDNNTETAEDTGYDSEDTATNLTNNDSASDEGLADIIEELNNQATSGNMVEDTGMDPMAPVGMDPGMMGAEQTAMPMESSGAMASSGPTASAGSTIPFQPGGSPAGQGLPEIGSKMPYVVRKGDTMAQISQTIYGSSSRWREMANLSGLENPSRIYPGDLVYYTLTEEAVPFAQAYENLPRSEEAVQPGDTLITISQRVYGTRENWKSIWRQNDMIDNPDTLTAGSVVYYINQQNLTAEVKKARKVFAALKAAKSATQLSAKTKISNNVAQISFSDITVACAKSVNDFSFANGVDSLNAANKNLKKVAILFENVKLS